MFARSSSIQAHPQSINAGITHIRDDLMPTLLGIDGCIGLSLLVDRDSGRCIATTAWQSREAMQASADQVGPLRQRAAEMFGGGSAQVDEWEIAVLHRDHTSAPGARVRVTWVRTDPGQVDRLLETYRMTILPRLEEIEGFCSSSMMLDRASGRGVGTATFDGAEALERSRETAGRLRETASREAGVEVVEVGEFELALAHLRVPEMA